MKKIFTFLLVGLVLLPAGLAFAADQKGPRIAVASLRYDLGKVTQGAKVSPVIEFRNAGSETLVIERVQSS